MRGRLLVGGALLVVGVAWILDLQGYTVFPGGFGTWWPLIIVTWGIVSLVTWPYWRAGPILIIGVGVLLQAWQLGYLPENTGDYIVPVALVAIAIIILAGAGRRRRWRAQDSRPHDWRHHDARHASPTRSGGREEVAIFSDVRANVDADDYKGGEFTAVFGNLLVDMSRARLAPDGASIKATGVFGSVEVRVPTEWRVEINGTRVFGDLRDDTTHPPAGPVLRVEAAPVFGNVRIANA